LKRCRSSARAQVRGPWRRFASVAGDCGAGSVLDPRQRSPILRSSPSLRPQAATRGIHASTLGVHPSSAPRAHLGWARALNRFGGQFTCALSGSRA
jgi:hypothetical protein